jgi:hypothetical protein
MAFRLDTFAGVTLPAYNWTADLGTPMTRKPVVDTLNGAIDFYGVRRRIEHSQEFELDADATPTASAVTTVRALKTLVGRTGYLSRLNTDGTGYLQRYCRLLWVGFMPKATQRGIANTLTMRFWTNEPFWRGAATQTHGPTSISSGSNINLTIAGEEDVLDATLAIAASSNISSITVSHTKTENSLSIISKFRKNNQLNSGTTWTVNTGLYTAKVGSTDDYANFSLDSTHNEVYWLRLPAGSQTLVITLGSGAGTYTLTYNAQYQ